MDHHDGEPISNVWRRHQTNHHVPRAISLSLALMDHCSLARRCCSSCCHTSHLPTHAHYRGHRTAPTDLEDAKQRRGSCLLNCMRTNQRLEGQFQRGRQIHIPLRHQVRCCLLSNKRSWFQFWRHIPILPRWANDSQGKQDL